MKKEEEDKTELEDLFCALNEAKKAFSKYFEDRHIEEAYFGMKLEGHIYGADFHSIMHKITIEDPRDAEVVEED